ncbi:MAG: hypothetical protein ACKOEV_06215, partial [Cytophagales bacterium]
RTFDVTGPETNTNHFTNSVHGMQRAGMNVSCSTPPLTNQTISKEKIKIPGYVREPELYERLVKAQRAILLKSIEQEF